MSIKLTSPIFVAGVLVPVDGATLSYDSAFESELVNRGIAVYVTPSPAQGGAEPVMSYRNTLTKKIEKLLAAGVAIPLSVILGQQHTPVSGPADTSENILFSLKIPGGLMGPNDAIRTTLLSSYTNSSNNKTIRIRLGGIAGALMMNNTMTTTQSCQNTSIIRNRNAVNSQISFAPASTGQSGAQALANQTASVDMSVDQDLIVTCVKASAGETITLESVLVELISGAQ